MVIRLTQNEKFILHWLIEDRIDTFAEVERDELIEFDRQQLEELEKLSKKFKKELF